MSGKNQQGNRGLVDLAMFKQQLLSHLLDEKLGALACDDSTRSDLRQHCRTVPEFRKHFGYPEEVKLIPWLAILSTPLKMFFDFMRAAVFTTEYDTVIKASAHPPQFPIPSFPTHHSHTSIPVAKRKKARPLLV